MRQQAEIVTGIAGPPALWVVGQLELVIGFPRFEAQQHEPGPAVIDGGDHRLGGKNWDDALVDFLALRFEEATGTPKLELLEDGETYQELLNEAEKLKVRLSQAKGVTQKVRHKAGEAKVDVTREKFDELTREGR